MPPCMALPKPILETARRSLSSAAQRASSVSGGSSGDKERERSLKGPVPLTWLEAAARLPGKSLHTGVALWYAAGLAQSASISLSNVSGHRFGLDRNAKYRALAWLENAGLIAVERKLGRAPVVTILHPERSI